MTPLILPLDDGSKITTALPQAARLPPTISPVTGMPFSKQFRTLKYRRRRDLNINILLEKSLGT